MEYPYKQKKIKGHNMLEHRYVMEKKIGRKLETYEHVHHINGKRKDNRPENLVILTKSVHSKLHKPQILPSIKICVICGNKFEPHPTKRRRQQICSLECKLLLMRKNCKARKLTDDQVIAIIEKRKQGIKLSILAKEYGVTESAISYNVHHTAGSISDI